jgi:hypothetical protein
MEFFSSDLFSDQSNPVSRNMRPTKPQGQYGRECGAGQPGIAGEPAGGSKPHPKPILRHYNCEPFWNGATA